ncbi:MAG: sulfotransferase domain-containing protein [Actinomycetes bacterium]
MGAPTDPQAAEAAARSSRPGPLRSAGRRAAYPARFAGRRLTALRRVRPDFLVIGAQKAGTTTLYARLSAHPSVRPALRKEVHWFDRAHREAADLRTYFPLEAEMARCRDRTGAALTGEATPFLLCHPLAPARARASIPDARILVLLRDPVERAVSGYHHAVRHGHEQRPPEVALDPDRAEPSGAPDDASWWDGDCPVRLRGYLERGHYVEQLERWLAEFPREQVCFLDPRDLSGGGAVDRAVEFLGLAPIPGPRGPDRNVGGYVPVAESALERRLRDHFAPHNARLWDLLGDDWGWPA